MDKDIFNDVLFAVTREDHRIEKQIIREHRVTKMLTICSGGCVPLSLKSLFPQLYVKAIDINQYQIEHVKKKTQAIIESDLLALNIKNQDDNCLNQSGKFEKMFQSLRKIFNERVAKNNEIESFFDKNTSVSERSKILKSWSESINIHEPFENVFNDRSIEKVFSNKANKHGEKGTYSSYFQKKIMRGLAKQKAFNNPFLQHIFLGFYQSRTMFPYMKIDKPPNIDFFSGSIIDIDRVREYNFVNLSNLFDWSDNEFVFQCVKKLCLLKRGSVVLLRQLNNHQDWFSFFSPNFFEDESFDLYWQKHDRSLFYDHFKLYIKK